MGVRTSPDVENFEKMTKSKKNIGKIFPPTPVFWSPTSRGCVRTSPDVENFEKMTKSKKKHRKNFSPNPRFLVTDFPRMCPNIPRCRKHRKNFSPNPRFLVTDFPRTH